MNFSKTYRGRLKAVKLEKNDSELVTSASTIDVLFKKGQSALIFIKKGPFKKSEESEIFDIPTLVGHEKYTC